MKLDVAVPLVVIPACLLFSTLSALCTLLGLAALPTLLLGFHSLWSQTIAKSRSKLFYVWGLFSTLFMFYTFEFVVVAFREVLLWENLTVVSLFGLQLYALYRAKRDTGVIHSSTTHNSHQQKLCDGEHLQKNSLGGSQDSVIDFDGSWKTSISSHAMGGGSAGNKQDNPHTGVLNSPDEGEVTWLDSRPIKGAKFGFLAQL